MRTSPAEARRESVTSVLAYLFYIDTLRIAFRAPLTADEGRELQRLYGRAWRKGGPITWDTRYPYVIILSHFPPPAALEYLASLRPKPEDHRVSVVHFAGDRIVANFAEAERLQLQNWLQVIQAGNRGWRKTHQHEASLYSGPRRTARNIAAYSDRRGKADNGPASHLELRFKGYHRSCKQFGTLADILALDIRQLFIRQTKIAEINPRTFHRLIDELVGTQMRRTGSSRSKARRALQRYICQGLLQHDEYVSPSLDDPSSIPCQAWIDSIPDLITLGDGIPRERFRSVILSTDSEPLWDISYGDIPLTPVSALAP